jgi:hypothetical protein
LNDFTGRNIKAAKKKALENRENTADTKRKEIEDGYRQNKPQVLCSLIESYMDKDLLLEVANDMCDKNKLLDARLDSLKEAKQKNENDKTDNDNVLERRRSEPITIEIRCNDILLIQGTTSSK